MGSNDTIWNIGETGDIYLVEWCNIWSFCFLFIRSSGFGLMDQLVFDWVTPCIFTVFQITNFWVHVSRETFWPDFLWYFLGQDFSSFKDRLKKYINVSGVTRKTAVQPPPPQVKFFCGKILCSYNYAGVLKRENGSTNNLDKNDDLMTALVVILP